MLRLFAIEGRYCDVYGTYCSFEGDAACLNGATCVNVGDGYVCNCAPGYTGLLSFFSFHRALLAGSLHSSENTI